MRQAHGFDNGVVENAHFVVLFQRGNHATQHGNGLGAVGFFNLHELKATLEGWIVFKRFLVFIEGGRSHRAQFSARQGGFEQVGRVARAGSATGADERVGFVDEKDDGSGRALHFLNNRFEAVFEFTLHAGPGLQQAQIERTQADLLKRVGYIARGDAQGESFHHCCFAHTGFAGEDWVILPATGEDVDHLTDFKIAANDRVDLAFAGAGGQVLGVLINTGSFRSGPWLPVCRGAATTGCRYRRAGGARIFLAVGQQGGKIVG